jgi:SAM-dependent methyltransferase
LCLENSLGVLAGSEVRVLAELARVCRPGGRVLLGARSLPAPSLERYASDDGYLELARVLPEAWTALLLRRVERGGRVRLLPRPEARGGRPWGGQVGYWALQRVG